MLTKRQKQILDFIKEYSKKHGFSPSLEETKKHFRLKSVSNIHQHIEALKNKGYLDGEKNRKRGLEIIMTEKMIKIPLLGTIAAGQPIEAIQEKETIVVSQNKIPQAENVYALRVIGDSMIEENINDGDVILVKHQTTAENGQKVVALIDNHEATLKKFYKEKNRIRLQPANKNMEPLIFRNGRDVSIQGIVLDVIREKTTIPVTFSSIKSEARQYKKIDLPKTIQPTLLMGDVMEKLKLLPDKSINCIVTSPPYWGQRDYGVKGQIGNEKKPEEYIKKMINVADELKRILTDDGAYFLNIGDKYVDKNLQMIPYQLAIEMQKRGWAIRNVLVWKKTNAMPSSIKDRFSNIYEPIFLFVKNPDNYLTPEYYFNLDSVRVAHKTNSDKKTESSRQKTLLTEEENNSELPLTLSIEEYQKWKNKNENNNNKYNGKFKKTNKINLGASPGARLSVYGEFYSRQRKHKINNDLELEIINFIKEYRKNSKITSKEIDRLFGYKDTAGHWFRTDRGGRCLPKPKDWFKLRDILGIKENKYDKIMTEEYYVLQTVKPHELGKNPGDVWDFSTGKLQDSHFAIFPEELPRRAILSCCPQNGIVLDPFVGSGTTLKIASDLNIKSIGIELQKNYIKIIKKRCGKIKILL
ncbi:MAG: transcriptional repressor LexA [Patescibacteria group bacterium]